MHKYPFILLIVITIVSVYLVLFADRDAANRNTDQLNSESTTKSAEFIPYSASFLIVTNGVSNDFSSPRFHNLSPEVYITAENPSVVNVLSAEVTWNDFFSSLPIGLSDKCLTSGSGQSYCDGNEGSLRFFLNGSEKDKVLDSNIQPNDQLLITYGTETENEINLQLMRFATELKQEKNAPFPPKEE